MRILVTGSAGLIGGEAVEHFGSRGHDVVGIDNNMRRSFFGAAGDVCWNLRRVAEGVSYKHHEADIRYSHDVDKVFKADGPFDAVIHCAAQPSHDKAREIPLVDFDVNARGTINLLEATRLHSPDAVFIFMSTNKVYGDAPNEIPVMEHATRWDYRDSEDSDGVTEHCRVDASTHSIFGASKLAADVMTQEYARTYGMRTVVLRGGCLTGPGHSGVELHGFLSFLVKTVVSDGKYNIYGYKGKQVRDNIHSRDVLRAMELIIAAPHPGEVYNIGGGRANSVSVIEAIAKIEQLTGQKAKWEYVPTARLGDHICYITDTAKLRSHYPGWDISVSLDDMISEMIKK